MSDDRITASVPRYIARVVGQSVMDVTELPGSVANRDYLVRLVDQSLQVVKIGPAAEMAREAWAFRLLGRLASARMFSSRRSCLADVLLRSPL